MTSITLTIMNTVFSYQHTYDVVNISELWVVIEVRREAGIEIGSRGRKSPKVVVPLQIRVLVSK